MSLGIDVAVRAVLTAAQPEIEAALGWPIELQDKYIPDSIPTGVDGEMQSFMFFTVMADRPAPFALARGGTIRESGLVQISVYVPDAKGPAASRLAGDLVRNLFPRLTTLGKARTERPAHAPDPLQESPYNHVPVTVPWVARVREGDR